MNFKFKPGDLFRVVGSPCELVGLVLEVVSIPKRFYYADERFDVTWIWLTDGITSGCKGKIFKSTPNNNVPWEILSVS